MFGSSITSPIPDQGTRLSANACKPSQVGECLQAFLQSQVCLHIRMCIYDLTCVQIRMCIIAYLQVVTPAKINACTDVCPSKQASRGASVYM